MILGLNKMRQNLITLSLFILFICSGLSGCMDNNNSEKEDNKFYFNHPIIFVDDDGDADFTSIQDALNNISNVTTIFVKSGTYYENIVINRSINITGEDKNTTIIDGDGVGHAIHVNQGNVNISGFTIKSNSINKDGIRLEKGSSNIYDNIIKNSYFGIFMWRSSHTNNISNNTIISNGYGISIDIASYGNDISDNIIKYNSYGINIGYNSDNNLIFENTISNNGKGIVFYHSSENYISYNTISNNQKIGVDISNESNFNRFWNNNFIDNNINSKDECINSWDSNNFGNYWSDYEEKYQNAFQIDGRWDKAYQIPGGQNEDRYPLVEPIFS
jgi:parallel beta-helix repeat protein